MAFTDRFIKVPTKCFDVKNRELTGKEILVDITTRINPFEISHYEETAEEGSNEYNYTSVTMKNGCSMCVYLPIDSFEAMLDKFGMK